MKLPFAEIIASMQKKADPRSVRKRQMRKKTIDARLPIGVFAVAVIVLAVLSVVTMVSQSGAGSTTENETGEGVNERVAAVPAMERIDQLPLSGNLLLVFTNDAKTSIHLLGVVNLDSESSRIKISYIPAQSDITVNGLPGNMHEHLQSGGVKELLWAVGDYARIGIERYICLDETDVVSIMKYIGAFEVTVEEDISHSYNGVSFVIDRGTHELVADSMLKYIIYLCDTMSSDARKLTDLMAGITGRLICDSEGSKQTSRSFEETVNFIDTDISAIDVSSYSAAIEKLFDRGGLWQIEIVPQASALSEIYK